MKRPNFFLIGAPKCGTTSLTSWLQSHPHVFLSDPKEPNFFSTDIGSSCAFQSIEEYEALFARAGIEHIAVGDASTTYVRSFVAVPMILRRYPESKFIVCLRNPTEMVASVHMQLLKGGKEPERSLEKAWTLQTARKTGQSLPRFCPEPSAFQYGDICSLGMQVERLLEATGKDRVLFLLLDDMRTNPGLVYQRVLTFLDLPDDGRDRFPVRNRRMEPRSRGLAQGLTRLRHVKFALGIHKPTGLGGFVAGLNNRRTSGNKMSMTMRGALRDFYFNDVQKLATLIERDLSGWLT